MAWLWIEPGTHATLVRSQLYSRDVLWCKVISTIQIALLTTILPIAPEDTTQVHFAITCLLYQNCFNMETQVYSSL